MKPLPRWHVFFFSAMALPVAAGLFRVWVHQDAVALGYRLSIEEVRRGQLREALRGAQVELAAERSPDHLASLATQLGLRPPAANQVLGARDGRPHGR